MNYQFLAPALDLDPYSGFAGYATVESFEADDRFQKESLTCPIEDGRLTFLEECRRVRALRARDHSIGPIVVRLMCGDIEEERELI